MNVALVCIALLGLLVFGLGMAVSLKRGQTDTVVGSSDDPTDPLLKLVRAHGNTAEYAAMFAVLMFVLGSTSPPIWAEWCMILATASRYLIAIGLIASPTLQEPHPLRFVGAFGTYIFGPVLCVAVLLGI
jgi:uncharacterized membrane protein YecN with MAPEG domain